MGSFYRPVNESQLVTATEDKSVVAFWWRHAPNKGLNNIDRAAEYLWNRAASVNGKFNGDDAGTLFTSLSRSEKLILIEDYLKNCYLDIARKQNIETSISNASTAAILDNDNNLELSG